MKRAFSFLLLLLIMLPIVGCFRMVDKTDGNIDMLTKTELCPIDKSNVDWITMTGGLGSITTKVMFNKTDNIVIDKITGMVNENKEMYELDTSTVESIFSESRPIGIVISFIDGKSIYLWPSYKTVRYADGNGTTVTTLKDRFIIQINQDDISRYYEVFSKKIANYLMDGWREDMPVVDNVKVESDTLLYDEQGKTLKDGDPVIISGDGCTSSFVDIFIRNSKDGCKWLIGQAETQLGAWQWSGNINRNISTSDGEKIQLEDGIYDIVVNLGNIEKAVCGVIRLETN